MIQQVPQLDANGRLRHLITLDGLDPGLLRELLERAGSYLCLPGQPPPRGDDLRGWTVANLFAEPSTRTRASFELAALRLGADVLNLDAMLSSRVKGESIIDTICTLEAMQVDVVVIRDAQPEGRNEEDTTQCAGAVRVCGGDRGLQRRIDGTSPVR